MFQNNIYVGRKETDESIGIIYINSSPFTGPNGHGKLLLDLMNLGIKKFVVAITDIGEKINNENLIYSTMQRKYIVEKAFKELNLEGRVVLVPEDLGLSQLFNYIAAQASHLYGENIRPVFCFEQDREEDFSQLFIKFDTDSQTIVNQGKFEFIINYETLPSVFEIVEDIKSCNIQDLLIKTGYSRDFINTLLDWYSKNKNILKYRNNFDAMLGKKNLPEFSLIDDYEMFETIEAREDTISPEDFIISEKLDGIPVFVGVDEFGFYFVNKESLNKLRRIEDVQPKYSLLFTKFVQSGIEEILNDWKQVKKCNDLKVQLEVVLPNLSVIEDSVQVNNIQYNADLIGNGICLFVQIIMDNVATFRSEIFSELQVCLETEGLKCIQNTTLDFLPIEVKSELDELAQIYEQDILDRKAIQEVERKIQKKILAEITQGLYSNDYEGLVISTKDGKHQYKILSEKIQKLNEMNFSGEFQKFAPICSVPFVPKTYDELDVEGSSYKVLKENTITKEEAFQESVIQVDKMAEFQFEQFRKDLKVFLAEIDSRLKVFAISSGETRHLFEKSYSELKTFLPKINCLEFFFPKDGMKILELQSLLRNTDQIGNFKIVKVETVDQFSEDMYIRYTGINEEAANNFGLDTIHVTWNYADYKNNLPIAWEKMLYYSSWEDTQNGIESTFARLLAKLAILEVSNREGAKFIDDKTGKAIDSLEDTIEYDITINGIQTNFIQQSEDTFFVLNSPTYVKDWKLVSLILFGTEEKLQTTLSFIRLCRALNETLSEEQLYRIFEAFIHCIWNDSTSQLLNLSEQQKVVAVERMLELITKLNRIECSLQYKTLRDSYTQPAKLEKLDSIPCTYIYPKTSNTFAKFFGASISAGMPSDVMFATLNLEPSENCFKALVENETLFYLDYEEFAKTNLGKELNATPEDFISLQVAYFDLPDDLVFNTAVLDIEEGKNISLDQIADFYNLLTSYGVCSGLIYNKIFVSCNNCLNIVAYTNDQGKTWTNVEMLDDSEYLKLDAEYDSSIIDVYLGNKTTEKEAIYKLLINYKYGKFTNIKIFDDKTISLSYKDKPFELLEYDQLLEDLMQHGYKIKCLDADIKIKDSYNIPADYWPKTVTGSLIIANLNINEDSFQPLSIFDTGTLYLENCCIQEDVFENWNIILDNKSYAKNMNVKLDLASKYEWAKYLKSLQYSETTTAKTFKINPSIQNRVKASWGF